MGQTRQIYDIFDAIRLFRCPEDLLLPAVNSEVYFSLSKCFGPRGGKLYFAGHIYKYGDGLFRDSEIKAVQFSWRRFS